MVEHQELEVVSPADDEAVWKYLGLAQYISMLKDSAIYFAPLSTFDDPFEGSSPYPLSMSSLMDDMVAKGQVPAEFKPLAVLGSQVVRDAARSATCVSCWHLSDHESDAMWRLYGRSDASVAIKTTCGKLRSQLPSGARFGLMRYIDFPTFGHSSGPISYDPVFLKRKSFEHEKEMRIKLELGKRDIGDRMFGGALSPATGKNIKVELSTVVECLVVNPTAPKWMADCIEDLTKRYEYQFQIRHSMLAHLPVY